MRLSAVLLIPILTLPALAGEPAPKAKSEGGLAEDQKVLYAVGVWLAGQVAPLSITASELKYVNMGLRDRVTGQKPQVDLGVYGPKINEFAAARVAAATEKEKKKSAAFVEKAAKEKGASSTSSGLVYTEVKAGTGAQPMATDTVRVHYEGRLANGAVFDSSLQRGTPAEFPLNGVIPCWTEGLQKVKVGGKARLVCPSAIAYGDQGRPNSGIPGGAVLVFDVELLDIVKAPPPAAAAPTSGEKKKSGN